MNSRSPHPLAEDLDEILRNTPTDVWGSLRDARVFLTGGTGFFGKWLLESWVWSSRAGLHRGRMTVLTRDPERFLKLHPQLSRDSSVDFLKGDVRDFSFPEETFTHILHAATPADVQLDRDHPKEMHEIIIEGTRRVLDLARNQNSLPRFLYASSGAVYGVQPPTLEKIPEDYEPTLSDIPASAYETGKREAESLCRDAIREGMPLTIARCFAFGGPYLPLDQQYALGNFIRDARAGSPIKISGDGTPLRSYLYAADLTIWLWTLLALGKSGRTYNVGSDKAYSIKQVAHNVANHYGSSVEIARTAESGKLPARYVPDTSRARQELGLRERISLPEIIARTEKFLSAQI